MTLNHATVMLAMLAPFQAPVVATSVGAALTVVVRKYGLRFQWCGLPLVHHTHTRPVPRLGGIAVYFAIVTGCVTTGLVFGFHTIAAVLPILLAVLPVLAIGAYDDLWHASPKTKIFAQILGAAILLAANWGIGQHTSVARGLLLVFWILLTTNSFNLIDGVDGLAAGTAIIIGGGLAAINFAAGNHALGALSLILLAASLGFLPFNVSGPKIFLGDSGSLSLGFILAAIAFETPHNSKLTWTAALVFGYPITETIFTLVRRMLKGRPLYQPDREHFHHKLRNSGISIFSTALVLCLVALAFVSLAVMIELGCPAWFSVACGFVLFLTMGKSFGYIRWRSLGQLRRVLRQAEEQEELPEIAGYLPYK